MFYFAGKRTDALVLQPEFTTSSQREVRFDGLFTENFFKQQVFELRLLISVHGKLFDPRINQFTDFLVLPCVVVPQFFVCLLLVVIELSPIVLGHVLVGSHLLFVFAILLFSVSFGEGRVYFSQRRVRNHVVEYVSLL